ncbi:MAG: hypothetical protein ACKVOB_00190 [Sphingomonas sp.]
MLSLRLSRALAQGRARHARADRALVLLGLLRKRAAAHNVGATDLEGLLRDQIRWSLPLMAGSAAGDQPAARRQQG